MTAHLDLIEQGPGSRLVTDSALYAVAVMRAEGRSIRSAWTDGVPERVTVADRGPPGRRGR
jgi:hypothetical protein